MLFSNSAGFYCVHLSSWHLLLDAHRLALTMYLVQKTVVDLFCYNSLGNFAIFAKFIKLEWRYFLAGSYNYSQGLVGSAFCDTEYKSLTAAKLPQKKS